MRRLLLPIVLLVTAGVYLQTLGHDFIALDDPHYVLRNAQVQGGLSWEGVRYAWLSLEMFNWHPLTWLSHMLDVELFGLEAGGHHLTSVLLHMANAALLFGLLRSMTDRFGESVLVAALFALHPLHVESVAWIAERKDVLCTFFWFLALWAYAGYAARPGLLRYASVVVLFALGLHSKPMIVTLPFVLLLLDVWPLGRAPGEWGFPASGKQRFLPASWPWLLVEKLPLLFLSLLSSLVTLAVQQPGVEHSAEQLPIDARLANAAVAYLGYLEHTFWPTSLAAFYPHRQWPSTRQIAAAVVVLTAFSGAAFRLRRARPYLAVGWLWFVGTLVPVIGIVQVGDQAMADRYTYVPLVGVFLAAVWGASDLVRRWRIPQAAVTVLVVVLLTALSAQTWRQAGRWSDTRTLFLHALTVTEDNYFAHGIVAATFLWEDQPQAAEPHLRRALEIDPNHPESLLSLGGLLLDRGDVEGAASAYARAVKVAPWLAEAQLGHAGILQRQGKRPAAIRHYRRAVAIDPSDPLARLLFARALEQSGAVRQAIVQYRFAVELGPERPEAREALERAEKRMR